LLAREAVEVTLNAAYVGAYGNANAARHSRRPA
jgi:hypothetical protein